MTSPARVPEYGRTPVRSGSPDQGRTRARNRPPVLTRIGTVSGRLLFWVALALLIVLPMLFLVVAGFSGRWPFPRVFPELYSLRAWRFVAADREGILRSLGSTTLYSLAVVLTTALFCWLPAQYLSRFSFRGQTLLEALLLTPALVPAITFSMGLQIVFVGLGLADTMVSVVLVLSLVAYPYMLRGLKTGYLAYRQAYDECARNLGAGEWQRLLQVELPMVLPAALSGGSVVFLVAFSEYFLVFLIGGGVVPSFPGYLVPFVTGSDRAFAAVLSLLFLCVPVLLFVTQELFLQWFYRRKGIEIR